MRDPKDITIELLQNTLDIMRVREELKLLVKRGESFPSKGGASLKTYAFVNTTCMMEVTKIMNQRVTHIDWLQSKHPTSRMARRPSMEKQNE